MNVTSNISYKVTYNLPNAQTMRFKTLSKQKNTKFSLISVQTIIANDCRKVGEKTAAGAAVIRDSVISAR